MFENDEFNNLDILIFCGGKCGSSTLHKTLLNNGFKTTKVHCNFNFMCLCNQYNKDKNKTIFDVIDFNKKQKTIYIIDSYRTPIERKISSFFQNINKHVPDYEKKSIKELIQLFNKNFLIELENYKSIDELFQHYKLPFFKNFDFKNKYNILEKGNIKFVKIRFSDIGSWGNILKNIFNKNITIHNDNLSIQKPTNNVYNEFKSLYKIPKNSLHKILEKDDDFKIYCTIEEQTKYIKYWESKSY